MKKLMAYTALVLLLLFSAGCKKNTEPADAAEERETGENSEPGKAEKIVYDDGFMFSYDGADIYMGEYIENILSRLGAESNSYVSESCTSEGMMAAYVYSGVEISAYAKTETDEYRVFSATFRDDSVATAEGVYIGMPVGEMEAAYEACNGDREIMEGFYYKYFKNGTALSFDADGEIIIGITYQLLVI
jgi:hypothetical protein